MISRREILAYLALAPGIGWAQPATGIYRIGTLSGGSSPKAKDARFWPFFFEGMRKLGYEEGRNVTYVMRYAEGVPARFPELARELLSTRVQLIVLTGATEAVAAGRATTVIPIVGIHVGDPVELGLAESLAHPGRNFTGSTLTIPGFSAKALELLLETLPAVRRVCVLANPTQVNYADQRKELERVAAAKGVTLLPTSGAARPEELGPALDRIEKDKPHALIVLAHALFLLFRDHVIAFAARTNVPTMYGWREDAEAGGLMAYAVETRVLFERAPVFIDKILKGTKPGDIPIEQPTRFGLWLNLKTARALGVQFPRAVLTRAEQVFE